MKTVELKKPHVVLGDNVDLLWDTNNGDVDSKPIILNHGVELPLFALKGIDDSEFSMTADDNLVTMVSTNKAGIRITKKFSARNELSSALHNHTGQPDVGAGCAAAMETDAGHLHAASGRGRYPVWGAQWHNGEDMEDIDESWFANSTLGCFPGTPRTEFRSAGQPINWVGVHNRFFAMTTMPDPEIRQGIIRRPRLLNHNHPPPAERAAGRGRAICP